MKIKDTIIVLTIFTAGILLGGSMNYLTSTIPAHKIIKELQSMPRTAITNEYNGKIKTRKGGEVLLDVNSAINDTIEKKWRLFGKKNNEKF